MNCKKCNSENVSIQKVSVTGKKRRGLMYWLLFGWLWDIILFLFAWILLLIIKILFPKKAKTKIHTMAVCQACGYSWKVKRTAKA